MVSQLLQLLKACDATVITQKQKYLEFKLGLHLLKFKDSVDFMKLGNVQN